MSAACTDACRFAAVPGLVAVLTAPGAASSGDAQLEHGCNVFFAASCVSCHGAGETLAGGRARATCLGSLSPVFHAGYTRYDPFEPSWLRQ
jgi:hypothetical protein